MTGADTDALARAPCLAMARNNAWANERLHDVLSERDSRQFAAERPGFFPSLSATMHHILQVDLYDIRPSPGAPDRW